MQLGREHSGTGEAVLLRPGERIGPYEIAACLGVGGMGEVYRATDTRLARSVALKTLRGVLGGDTDLLQRFQREARILASLNHPNVAAIYDVQENAGAPFLVMELVEGETLARRLDREPLPLEDALEICKQVAEALEAAHDNDVLHRDLKPANIQITPAGRAKVLDFGIAKIVQRRETRGAPGAPTEHAVPQTEGGIVLGTSAYMSPEQARGQSVDRQTDLWAFGCVLYEVLAGRPAFQGEGTTDVLASVVKDEPDWSALPPATPPVVRSLLRQCLRKQPAHRLHDARAAKLALEDALAEPMSSADRHSPSRAGVAWSRVLPLGALLLVAGAVAAVLLRPAPPVDRPIARVLLDVAPAERLAGIGAVSPRPSRSGFALSPDGRTVVFSGVRGSVDQLFRRALDATEAEPLPGTEGALGPFFSPDGRWVGYWAGGRLMKGPLDGGPPVHVADVAADFGMLGADWGSDDSIVFSAQGLGIERVGAGGGGAEWLTRADPNKAEVRHILPQLLPGGKALLFTVLSSLTDWERAAIVVQSLETGERRTLLTGGADARYTSTGHLVYVRSGALMAVGFDVERLALTGSPITMLDSVMQSVNPPFSAHETGQGQFSIADNGTLAYLPGGIFPVRLRELVWVDRAGNVEPLDMEPGPYFYPRLSPDGRRVAFHAVREESREYFISAHEIGRQAATRLTFDGDNCCPVWAPDSRSLVFRSVVPGQFELRRMSVDGSGAAERLFASPFNAVPSSWSGPGLAFVHAVELRNQAWVLPMDGAGEARSVVQTPVPASYPALSSDGRWLAYVTAETGRPEVYVQPYPGPGARVRVSTAGGQEPVFAADGRELFYVAFETGGVVRLMAVDVSGEDDFQAGRPRELFAGTYVANSPVRGYDVTPDGTRFVMMRAAVSQAPEEEPFTQLNLVLNWAADLARRVPGPGG